MGSPPKSQITVRTFHCAWNATPWSMPNTLPSFASRQWPPLRSVLLITMSNSGHAAELVAMVLEQREVVVVGVVLDEPLHAADAGRSVAQHRVGDDVPAERVGDLVGRDLAVTQRAAREVPERPLTLLRLVDRQHLLAGVTQVDQQRRVRRPGQPPEDLHLPVAQQIGHEGQFQRGQMWPLGSIGKSQSWHLGRPASTDSAPCATIARTCARVA